MKKAPKKLWFVILIVIIIVAISVWAMTRKPKIVYTTVPAEAGPLIQTVSETGTVKPIKEIFLNFLTAGKISAVNVKVGDQVSVGQALASLDDSSLNLKKLEIGANIKIAEANLSKINAGASQEAINISRRSLEQAQASQLAASYDQVKAEKTSLENIRQAKKTYDDLVSSSSDTQTTFEQAVISAETSLANAKKTYQKTVDNTKSSLLLVLSDKILTVRVALDNIFKILDDDAAKIGLSALDGTYKTNTENTRQQILAAMPNLEAKVALAKKTGVEADIYAASDNLDNILIQTADVLDSAYSMLEKTVVSSGFSQNALEAYKASIISQNSLISAANLSLESALQAYKNSLLSYDTSVSTSESALSQAQVSLSNAILNAENNLNNVKLNSEQQNMAAANKLASSLQAVNLAQAQYENAIAPARVQDKQLAEAQVSQAQAALASIEKQIKDSKLESPLAGVITEVNYEAGEQFGGAGQAMIKMLVENSFDIEVDITEANISKIKINNPVNITLDAFPDDLILKGFVSFIEPAQTLISGVVYYKVRIEFSDLITLRQELKDHGLSLKAGMTANPVITTDSRANVISIPSRSIVEENKIKKVKLLVNGSAQEVIVETGLRGDNGSTEILRGISAGDQIITSTK